MKEGLHALAHRYMSQNQAGTRLQLEVTQHLRGLCQEFMGTSQDGR